MFSQNPGLLESQIRWLGVKGYLKHQETMFVVPAPIRGPAFVMFLLFSSFSSHFSYLLFLYVYGVWVGAGGEGGVQ